jgi:hypothetical protein
MTTPSGRRHRVARHERDGQRLSLVVGGTIAVRSRVRVRVAPFDQELGKAPFHFVGLSNLVRGEVKAFVTKSRKRFYPNPQGV